MDEDQAPGEIGWYVSDVHCTRAIKYLREELVSKGYLPAGPDSSLFLAMWGEALQQTMDVKEPSPIGAEPEHARKFVLTTVEARITQLEDRQDRLENGISYLNRWLHTNITRYGHKEEQELERILYGPATTSSKESSSRA